MNSTIWNELFKVSLLGTDKATLGIATKQFCIQQRINESEEDVVFLLKALSLLQVAKKGSTQLAIYNGTLSANEAIEETLPYAHYQLIPYLKNMMNERYEPILLETVELMSEKGLILPIEVLVSFLNFVKNKKDFHSFSHQIIGNRGHWLQNVSKQWIFLSKPMPFDEEKSKQRQQLKDNAANTLQTLIQKLEAIVSSDDSLSFAYYFRNEHYNLLQSAYYCPIKDLGLLQQQYSKFHQMPFDIQKNLEQMLTILKFRKEIYGLLNISPS